MRSSRSLAVLVLLVALVACSDDDGGDGAASDTTSTTVAPLPAAYDGYTSDVYADPTSWLCHPDAPGDVCARDLDATVVQADGTLEVREHVPAADPVVDCFYVYPTVSTDTGVNADMEPGEPQEVFVTLNQAARLTASCRVFAPIYRQLPLSYIGGGGPEPPPGVDPRAIAYGDVVDAFRHFVANETDGRGFVLVGHSQGAGHLRRLIQDEIDDEPALRDRLVAAYLLGSLVEVPADDVVGGDFANVPLCEADDQTGCVVTYASFRSTAPPPADSFFASVDEGDGRAGCVNPANLTGDRGWLEPYFQVDAPTGSLGRDTNGHADPDVEIATPFIVLPDFVEGECVEDGRFHYLSLIVHPDPADPRTDDIGGDLTPQWGMHLVDVNVAMGNIVDLVATQAEAYGG